MLGANAHRGLSKGTEEWKIQGGAKESTTTLCFTAGGIWRGGRGGRAGERQWSVTAAGTQTAEMPMGNTQKEGDSP